MASLIKKETLLNHADQAPSPQKDFCQILVTTTQVIFRWWKITLRQNATALPGEIIDSHEDFLYDERCQSEVHRVFGRHMLEYVKTLCKGHIDYLPRLPNDLLIKILCMVDLTSLTSLSLTNKMFNEMCNGNELWEHIYHDHSETPITDDLRSLAEGLGWKRLFYTNKLQLRMQLSRQAKSKGADDPAFLTHMDDQDDD